MEVPADAVAALKATAEKAGYTLADVVQMRLFTTDITAMTKSYGELLALLEAEGCRVASLMTEVTALSDRT